jgi:hypothetical protein
MLGSGGPLHEIAAISTKSGETWTDLDSFYWFPPRADIHLVDIPGKDKHFGGNKSITQASG